MEQIQSYQELTARPNFHPALAFGPNGEKFGQIIQPVYFDEDAHCGIASCRQRYRRGYLIQTKSGAETAIGSHCGQKHLGASFKDERRRVDEALARTRKIASIREMLERLPTLISEINQLETDYNQLKDMREWLHGAVGVSVFQELRVRANRGEPNITRHVILTGAEAQAWRATNSQRKDKSAIPTREEIIGTLRGLGFFKGNIREMLVTNLINPLRDLAGMSPEDVATMKPRALNATAKWVGEVPGNLRIAQAVVAAGRDFFTAENVALLEHLGASKQALTNLVTQLPTAAS